MASLFFIRTLNFFYIWKIYILLTLYCFFSFNVLLYSTERTKELNIITKKNKKQTLYQTYSLLTKNNELFYLYSVHTKDWKIKIGQRKKGNRYISSFGLKTIPFTIGSIQQYGEYKTLQDISQTLAWSSVLFQAFSWNINNTSAEPIWGARLGIDPIQTWLIQKKESNLYGIALGYDFSFYEPRLLYQHSRRNTINTNNLYWKKWVIQKPSSTELHQLAFSQTFSILNSLYGQAILISATSNTQAPRMAGYITIQYFTTNADIKLNYSHSDKEYISQEWIFAKYLWSSSIEFSLYYLSLFSIPTRATQSLLTHSNAKIRLRAIIREYHPLNIQHTKEEYLYQKYEIMWKHDFIKNKMEYLPRITYIWHLAKKYHTIKQELSIVLGNITLTPSLSSKFLYKPIYSNTVDKHTNPAVLYTILDTVEIIFTQKIKYAVLNTPLRFFAYFTLINQADITNNSIENLSHLSTVKEVHSALGLSANIKYLRIHATYKTKWFPQKNTEKLQLTLDIGIRYTIK